LGASKAFTLVEMLITLTLVVSLSLLSLKLFEAPKTDLRYGRTVSDFVMHLNASYRQYVLRNGTSPLNGTCPTASTVTTAQGFAQFLFEKDQRARTVPLGVGVQPLQLDYAGGLRLYLDPSTLTGWRANAAYYDNFSGTSTPLSRTCKGETLLLDLDKSTPPGTSLADANLLLLYVGDVTGEIKTGYQLDPVNLPPSFYDRYLGTL
jgi:prepilin-type N-terminal cleavage/methylation domain-containing protein